MCRTWCGPIARTPAAAASLLNRSVTLSGRSGRFVRPVNMYALRALFCAWISVLSVMVSSMTVRMPLSDLGRFSRTTLPEPSTTRCRRTFSVARSVLRSVHFRPHSSPRRSPDTSSSRHSG